METNNKKNSIKSMIVTQNNNEENNFNLNEIAINSKIPENKENTSNKNNSKKSFENFYYSMWISNKD
jgi:hypothetical protein